MDLSESDISRLRSELLASARLRGEPAALREEIVEDALAEIATRFAGAPLEERRRIAHAIVRYMLWSHRRRRTRERAVELPGGDEIPARVADPADRLELIELREELYKAALEFLSEEERRALYLRFFSDLTAAEAAEAMGLPLQRVYYLTRRAVENLQRALGAFPDLLDRSSATRRPRDR